MVTASVSPPINTVRFLPALRGRMRGEPGGGSEVAQARDSAHPRLHWSHLASNGSTGTTTEYRRVVFGGLSRRMGGRSAGVRKPGWPQFPSSPEPGLGTETKQSVLRRFGTRDATNSHLPDKTSPRGPRLCRCLPANRPERREDEPMLDVASSLCRSRVTQSSRRHPRKIPRAKRSRLPPLRTQPLQLQGHCEVLEHLDPHPTRRPNGIATFTPSVSTFFLDRALSRIFFLKPRSAAPFQVTPAPLTTRVEPLPKSVAQERSLGIVP